MNLLTESRQIERSYEFTKDSDAKINNAIFFLEDLTESLSRDCNDEDDLTISVPNTQDIEPKYLNYKYEDLISMLNFFRGLDKLPHEMKVTENNE